MSGGSGIVAEMKRNFGNFMTKLGAHVIHLGYNIVGRAFDKVRGGFSRIAAYIREKSRLKEYLINTVTDLKHKKKSIEHFLFWLYEDVEAKRANEGPFKAAGLWIGRVSRKLWHLRGGLVTIFNWVAPVVSLVFMFSVINSVSNLAYGVSVEYNGQSLGMLGAESDYDEAEKVLQDRIMYVEGNEKVTIAPKLSVQLITDEQEIVDSEELVDKILINTDVELTEACGVYIDGEFLGAVESKQAVESVLSRILSKYRDDGVKSVAFEKDVQLSEGLYLKDSIVANDEVLDIIMSDVSTDVYYEVQKGDTPIKIASMAGIPLTELRRLNPDIDNNMKVGDTVTLNVAEPYMSVNVVKEVEYTAPVPYDTVTSESNLVYQGDKRTVVEGVEGEAVVLADVTTRNGIEVSRTVLEETIVVEPVTEEIVEGMEHEHEDEEHDHGHEDESHDHEGLVIEYDEHVWTSPRNAVAICEAICERFCRLDPEGERVYRENLAAYREKLLALDEEFRRVTGEAPLNTLVFADRFPVRYFVEEYGLDYFAAYPGCNSQAEPSARTVAFLIDKVRELGSPAVLYIEFSNEKMADILCEDTGCKKLPFHSCHNVSARQFQQGVGYLELMEGNLESLKEALGWQS